MPTATTQPPRRSFLQTALAASAIVGGLSGFLCFLCVGPALLLPAFVCAIIPLLCWRKSSIVSKVVAIFGLCLGILVGAKYLKVKSMGQDPAIVAAPMVAARVKASEICCRINLERIGKALKMYAAKYDGAYPVEDGAQGLAALADGKFIESYFNPTCPFIYVSIPETMQEALNRPWTYFYNGGHRKDEKPPVPVAGDLDWAHGDWGMIWVLMSDGSVVRKTVGKPFTTRLVWPPDKPDARTPVVLPPKE